MQSQIIEKFTQEADDVILCELLKTYSQFLDLTDDEKTQKVVEKLTLLFEEGENVYQ
jgi:hypothetical protein